MMEEKKPTVVPASEFNADEDASQLNGAFKDFGNYEDVVTTIFAGRSLQQRQSIQEAYKAKFNKELLHEVQSDVSGNYLMALEGLLDDPADFHAKYLHEVICGSINGCRDVAVLEILCPLTSVERKFVAAAYTELFSKTILKDVEVMVSGPFKKVVVTLLQDGDVSESLMKQKVENDSNSLVSLKPNDWTPENNHLIDILVRNNPMTLLSVINAYKAKTNKDLSETVTSHPEANYRNGFKIIVEASRDKWLYFANQIYQSMKGNCTNGGKAIYIIVFRCESDLRNIADVFCQTFQRSLQSFIREKTSEDYGNLLLSLVGPESAIMT